MKKTILTGLRPTGNLHLGHYFGAGKTWRDIQDDYDFYLEIADVQALTDNFDNPEKVRHNVYEIAKNSLKEIGKYGEDCGVYPCIENMPNIEGFMYKDINHLNQTLEELDLPMTLDIGHAHHAGFSPKEFYFDRIKHIHVHNNYGDDDTHNQLNEGTFFLFLFFDIFIDKKYDGIYMLEMFNKDFIENSIEYLKDNKYI